MTADLSTESEEMAWVRYDDQFPMNAKVGVVLAEDPGALALHLLATTWTSARNKSYGHIPPAQAVVLLADRGLAAKWSALLVQARLWHAIERLDECADCAEEYADLPRAEGGWVIHNADKYRPPASQRQVPGTPEELSAKRAEAGRRGGLKTQANGRDVKQPSSKRPSKTEQELSNTPSPVPVPVVALSEQQQPLATLAPPNRAEALPGMTDYEPSGSQQPTGPHPDEIFEIFWKIYPRKVGKQEARKVWLRKVKGALPAKIIEGAERFANDPNREQEFTPHPSTWLNQGRWEDEPLPQRGLARAALPSRNDQRMNRAASLVAELEGGGDPFGYQPRREITDGVR